ncbi:helix-turn-helix transcriptional regulator [Janthinobacterium sp. 17J80-10]|uniref:helix-turn-helix domain-containing protein n=1 Tax=Janthinobacterium sp. 17J80-10 TaxID=2497863 RepID=UPI0010059059|nr:helix-turn-helix transcriptional regulator [Janthinobacterium sp. 17J80-10]QAU33949.1 XRE family transcriptional regulator [Janthinobacterium sp. 17J80-10]
MQDLTRCFGLTIRQLRELLDWSQEALAEKANLNRSYLGEIERGKAIPSLVTMDKLAVALAVSLPELLNQCEQRRRSQTIKAINLMAIAC